MSQDKCFYCSSFADFFYNKKELCPCHYWIERGRPRDSLLMDGMLRALRNLHPIRMKVLCDMDKEFSDYMASIQEGK